MKQDQVNKPVIQAMTYIMRMGILLSAVMMFFPSINPSRINGFINKTMSLFTSAVSYSSLTKEAGRAISKGWISEGTFALVFAASIVVCLGIGAAAIGASISVGNLRLKNIAIRLTFIGSIVQIIGLLLIYLAYQQVMQTEYPERVVPQFPFGYFWFMGIAVIVLITSIILYFT